MNIKLAIALGAASVALISASAAMADILPSGPAGTVVSGPVAGVYTYSYDMALATPETLKTSDYFTIYDFNGFTGIADVTAPLGWTFATSATGTTPSLTAPTDTSLPNVTFTWGGGTVTSPAELGIFSLKSTVAPVVKSTQYAGSLAGGDDQFLHRLTGPAPVPEPATTVPFVIGGLALLGLVVRKTRRAGSVSA